MLSAAGSDVLGIIGEGFDFISNSRAVSLRPNLEIVRQPPVRPRTRVKIERRPQKVQDDRHLVTDMCPRSVTNALRHPNKLHGTAPERWAAYRLTLGIETQYLQTVGRTTSCQMLVSGVDRGEPRNVPLISTTLLHCQPDLALG